MLWLGLLLIVGNFMRAREAVSMTALLWVSVLLLTERWSSEVWGTAVVVGRDGVGGCVCSWGWHVFSESFVSESLQLLLLGPWVFFLVLTLLGVALVEPGCRRRRVVRHGWGPPLLQMLLGGDGGGRCWCGRGCGEGGRGC